LTNKRRMALIALSVMVVMTIVILILHREGLISFSPRVRKPAEQLGSTYPSTTSVLYTAYSQDMSGYAWVSREGKVDIRLNGMQIEESAIYLNWADCVEPSTSWRVRLLAIDHFRKPDRFDTGSASIAFAFTGNQLAVLAQTQLFHVDANRKTAQMVSRANQPVTSFAWSLDGSLCYAAGRGKRSIARWRTSSAGEEVSESVFQCERESKSFRSIENAGESWAPNGEYFAFGSADGKRLCVLALESGTEATYAFDNANWLDVAWKHDSTSLVAMSYSEDRTAVNDAILIDLATDQSRRFRDKCELFLNQTVLDSDIPVSFRLKRSWTNDGHFIIVNLNSREDVLIDPLSGAVIPISKLLADASIDAGEHRHSNSNVIRPPRVEVCPWSNWVWVEGWHHGYALDYMSCRVLPRPLQFRGVPRPSADGNWVLWENGEESMRVEAERELLTAEPILDGGLRRMICNLVPR